MKEDLTLKKIEWEIKKTDYLIQAKEIDYIRKISNNKTISKDSLSVAKFFQNQNQEESNGRYEGFLSSGKIGNIESDLQNDILKLYQQKIPSLNKTVVLFENRKEEIIKYMQQNSKVILNENKSSICSIKSRSSKYAKLNNILEDDWNSLSKYN